MKQIFKWLRMILVLALPLSAEFQPWTEKLIQLNHRMEDINIT